VSLFSEFRRREVNERASHRCEYCHLPIRGQVATFPIDHIIPHVSGGTTTLENLALACPHCNAHKGKLQSGVHPDTGNIVAYFHPRIQRWGEHFEWSQLQTGELVGKTEVGIVTIWGLKMNADEMIRLRQLLAELNLFSFENI
jgi:hypothetical protein